ncbi:AzlC family ABC transporter permease [Staphylococcus sp. SQ8-PEA]|uniref:AzlC family ABC transporter permease n=1 Tax=Staphylococcus marylandisciuri TaxID=2981529 RepID=A0ABT2QSZ0_9STAP|nr:AzlC family ABC transporter permease [Staphylococcus marylandisciuri]MCU5747068.1 AzlC family ABC transporter permease [Staphylococcus marylandisciuri]
MNHSHLPIIKLAFNHTLPILAGFTFLGVAYGIYMHSLGFAPIFASLMSAFIFAGSMEFIAGSLLLGVFSPLSAFILTLMINARHLFYGISMLEEFKRVGIKKYYLIFGMCDETFVINKTATVPSDIDKGWFMFYVTLLNHCYWVCGATLGGISGNYITFNTLGLSFVMTALFVVIFVDNWMKENNHLPSIIGLMTSLICLIMFGTKSFILPTMIIILVIFIVFKSPLEAKVRESQ